jgi:hypothetical protein
MATRKLLALLCVGVMACVVGEFDENAPPTGGGGDGTGGGGGDGTGGGGGGGMGGADAGPEAPTARSVLEDFAACMTFDDWEAQNLGQIALIQSSQGACYTCHDAGQNGNYLRQDSLETFQAIRAYPYVMRYAQAVGPELTLEASDDFLRKSQEANGVNHPSFLFELDLGIQNFFELTHQRYLLGDCEEI